MPRFPLSTDIKTRTGIPANKDARLINAYVETKGPVNDPNNPPQSIVRKRPCARGGVAIGTGTAQGGLGFSLGGTDYIYTFNGDVGSLNTSAAGTNWNAGTAYSIGDHVSVGFQDYWALSANTNSLPSPSNGNWSTIFFPAIPKVYATFDPLHKGVSVSLSGSNLTASIGDGSVRSTISKSSGKWYWEYLIVACNPTNNTSNIYALGICNSISNMNVMIGAFADGWAYVAGNIVPNPAKLNGVASAYGSLFNAGDIIGVALDMDVGTIQFYWNGASQGVAYNGLSGGIYSAVGLAHVVNETLIITANFGASPFTYSAPIGYNSGLYQ